MATENSSTAQRGYGRGTRILSLLSATWCGIALVVAGACLTMSGGNELYTTLIAPWANASEHAGEISAIILFSSFFVLVLGVAFGRFLVRVMPPQFSDRARLSRFKTLGMIILCIGYFFLFYVAVVVFAVVSASSSPNDAATSIRILAGSFPFAVFWLSGSIGPLVLRHRKPRAFLSRPFVLFLRRFSTFSDRTVIAQVLRQAASGVPVVFLTPTSSQPRDWDPFVVGFAGLKLLHPWLSVPIVLRARDDEWQQAADELIRRAQTILLDASEPSSALRSEVEMIENAKRWPDTVLLRLLCPDGSPSEDLFGSTSTARVIDYKKSWVQALPRILIGLVIFPLVTSLVVSVFLSPVLFNFWPALWVLNIIIFVAAFSMFVRPTINREARAALRTVLGPGT